MTCMAALDAQRVSYDLYCLFRGSCSVYTINMIRCCPWQVVHDRKRRPGHIGCDKLVLATGAMCLEISHLLLYQVAGNRTGPHDVTVSSISIIPFTIGRACRKMGEGVSQGVEKVHYKLYPCCAVSLTAEL